MSEAIEEAAHRTRDASILALEQGMMMGTMLLVIEALNLLEAARHRLHVDEGGKPETAPGIIVPVVPWDDHE